MWMSNDEIFLMRSLEEACSKYAPLPEREEGNEFEAAE
jgi:hypothetical protein